MPDSKFKISRGETRGSKQADFFFCSKVTWAELKRMRETKFPEVSDEELYVLPTLGCTVTPSKDFEVKPL